MLQMKGVKSRSAEKAEMQHTPASSSVENMRPSLKRKHEEDSSKHPQYQVLQIANSVKKEKSQHGETPLLATIKKEPFEMIVVKQEPPDCTIAKQEPPDYTIVKQEPPNYTIVKQGPPDCTIIKQEPPDYTIIKQEPPDYTIIKQESVDTIPSKLLKETDSESIEDPRLSTENTNVLELDPNEHFKIVDIQDIFKRSSETKKNTQTSEPKVVTSVVRDSMGNIVPSECSVCQKLFINEATLKSHMVSDHPKNRPTSILLKKPQKQSELECTQSHYVSLLPNPKTAIECSYSALESFYQHFCKFHLKSENSRTMTALMTIPCLFTTYKPHRNILNKFQCPKCSFVFQTLGSIIMHLSNDHSNSDLVECKVCHFVTNFQKECISIHFKKHRFFNQHFVDTEQIWQCTECQRLSAQCIQNLEEEQKYVIRFHFKNIIVIRNHSLNTQNSPTLAVYFRYKFNNSLPMYQHKRQLFQCSLCSSESFETSEQLDRHLDTHVDFVFRKCAKCGAWCKNMNGYYQHVDKNHGSCLMPDVDFRTKKVQFYHQSSEYVGTNSSFLNSCCLQIHIRRQSKIIFRRQHLMRLNNHIPTTDTNYSTSETIDPISETIGPTSDTIDPTSDTNSDPDGLQCPICDVLFTDSKLFYAHCVPYIKLFTNLPLECSVCRLKFKSEQESQTHVRKVHARVEAVCCGICNVRQNSVKDLERHVSKEHNIPMIHCCLCNSNISTCTVALIHFQNCYMKNKPQDFICPLCGFNCENYEFLINHMRVEFDIMRPKYQCKLCLNFFYGKFNLAHHLLHGKCMDGSTKIIYSESRFIF